MTVRELFKALSGNLNMHQKTPIDIYHSNGKQITQFQLRHLSNTELMNDYRELLDMPILQFKQWEIDGAVSIKIND